MYIGKVGRSKALQLDFMPDATGVVDIKGLIHRNQLRGYSSCKHNLSGYFGPWARCF